MDSYWLKWKRKHTTFSQLFQDLIGYSQNTCTWLLTLLACNRDGYKKWRGLNHTSFISDVVMLVFSLYQSMRQYSGKRDAFIERRRRLHHLYLPVVYFGLFQRDWYFFGVVYFSHLIIWLHMFMLHNLRLA